MEIWTVGVFVLLFLTASVKPEIPSKGKHTAVLDARQQSSSNEDADMPRFAEPISNVTVSIGRDALLACVVENLKGYKVAWVRVDTQTILSIHHNLISQNSRISLTYNDHRSWYLHIREVEESDRGWYMCQINTDPMRSRKGYLQVVVPPTIIEGLTSNDLVVREGLNVTLVCKARGYPEPYVMWRREDGEEMLIGGEHVNVVDGEYLHITKVSRLHMAAYLCVASNGVPPSISKRVHLRVQFPPMLSIPNQLEGAYIGQDVVLECHTEAYPASINYWTTERGDMIISDTSRAGDKYETTSTVSGYTKFMKLKIRSVGPNDFGTYRCVAKNSLGETDGNIKLDEMPSPTTSVISEIGLWNRTLDGKRRNRNKFDLNALPDYGVEEWRDGAGNGGLNGGNNIHVNGNDNNQTPVRNPPGAFHNSAGGGLAQHNLLGRIIHGIKMQSFGIFQHLSNYFTAKRIESINVAGIVKRESQKDMLAEQQNHLFTNQMIVFLSLTEPAMLNVEYDQTPTMAIVNSNKNGNVHFYPLNSINRCRVDGNQMNNRIVSFTQTSSNNKNSHKNTKLIQWKQEKQEQKQHSKLSQLSNNININMLRSITNIHYWQEAPSEKEKDVGDNYSYTTVTTRVILKLASLLPTSPSTMAAKLICIIIFSISIMLLLLHLIIDGRRITITSSSNNNSICCTNNINTTHNNTSEAYNTAATSTSTQSINENRLLPLQPVAQPSSKHPPAKSPIPSSKPSSTTNVSQTEKTSSHRKQQQLEQLRQRQQQINKFNNTTKTTTSTPIIVSIHPLLLAKFPGIILHKFHKLPELR